ncbi:MAG: hypothetical protein KKD31_12655, partial [Bacteroidetes bacterium]|nr:hypothetical protein [Bacteroidota bacterium]
MKRFFSKIIFLVRYRTTLTLFYNVTAEVPFGIQREKDFFCLIFSREGAKAQSKIQLFRFVWCFSCQIFSREGA